MKVVALVSGGIDSVTAKDKIYNILSCGSCGDLHNLINKLPRYTLPIDKQIA